MHWDISRYESVYTALMLSNKPSVSNYSFNPRISFILFSYYVSQHQSQRNGSEGFSSSLKFVQLLRHVSIGGVSYVCKNPLELLNKV